MRGAKPSTKTAAERKAAALEQSRVWYQRHAVANLAAGLRSDGKPRRYRAQLSPKLQQLVAEYKARQAKANEPVKRSALEEAWRAERESMGVIEVPEIKLYTVGRGED